MTTDLLTFLGVAAIAIATPGPTVLLALSNGARSGLKGAAWGIAGAALSDIVLIGTVSAGLAAVLTTSQLWFDVLKWLGVAYLCYLGLGALVSGSRSGGSSSGRMPAVAAEPAALFMKAFLVAVTNPKAYLFFTALLPQFIDASAPVAGQYLLLGAIFTGLDLAIMLIYARIGQLTRHASSGQAGRWIELSCGIAFLALAAMLALYGKAEGHRAG